MNAKIIINTFAKDKKNVTKNVPRCSTFLTSVVGGNTSISATKQKHKEKKNIQAKL